MVNLWVLAAGALIAVLAFCVYLLWSKNSRLTDANSRLAEARRELEEAISERAGELELTVEQLRKAEERRRKLLDRTVKTIEDERRQIGHEVHDALGSGLAVTRVLAQRAHIILREDAAGEPADAQRLDELRDLVEKILTSTSACATTARNISKRVRPEALDVLGLAPALQGLVKEYSQAHATCEYSYFAAANVPPLKGDRALAVYRVAQEALTNTVKHANASRVVVTLQLDRQGDLQLRISDNGRAFDIGKGHSDGLGIVGMRERMAAFGGSLEITVSETATEVCATIPLTQPEATPGT